MSAFDERRDACNALYAAGHYLLERDRVQDAASLFRTMLLADAEDERGWLALGHCHELLGHHAMADEIYGAGVQMTRTKVRLFVAIARLYRSLGDDRADEVLECATSCVCTDEENKLVIDEQNRRAA